MTSGQLLFVNTDILNVVFLWQSDQRVHQIVNDYYSTNLLNEYNSATQLSYMLEVKNKYIILTMIIIVSRFLLTFKYPSQMTGS